MTNTMPVLQTPYRTITDKNGNEFNLQRQRTWPHMWEVFYKGKCIDTDQYHNDIESRILNNKYVAFL